MMNLHNRYYKVESDAERYARIAREYDKKRKALILKVKEAVVAKHLICIESYAHDMQTIQDDITIDMLMHETLALNELRHHDSGKDEVKILQAFWEAYAVNNLDNMGESLSALLDHVL